MNTKLHALTSLRFFAALAVVIYHMSDYSLESSRGPLEKAHLAVDLFFILSGFILAHVYGNAFVEKRESARTFLIARFARIYPAHLVMMIIFLLYVTILGAIGFPYNADRYRVESFFWHVTLLDASGIDTHLTWNFPAWSISAEFFAYLIFPIFVRPLMQLRPQVAFWSLLLLITAFVLLDFPLRLTQRTVDFSVIRILPEFLMGVLAYRIRDRLVGYVGNATVAFVCVVLSIVLLTWIMAPDPFIVAAFVALIVLGPVVTGYVAAVLSWRPFVYLGEISYSLYMVHAFILSVVYNLFKIKWISAQIPSALLDWLVVLLVLVAACVLYHLVEKPGRQLIRNTYIARAHLEPKEAIS